MDGGWRLRWTNDGQVTEEEYEGVVAIEVDGYGVLAFCDTSGLEDNSTQLTYMDYMLRLKTRTKKY